MRISNWSSDVCSSDRDGFTVGIAVIIATSQLQDLLGLEAASVPADFLEKPPALWALRDSFTPSALALGLATILLIVGFRRFAPRLPGLTIAARVPSAATILLAFPRSEKRRVGHERA